MNFLKYLALTPLVGGTLTAAIVYDFEAENDGDFFDGDVTGWTQDSPNLPGFFGGPDSPHAYLRLTSNFSGTPSITGQIGTRRANTPDRSSTTVTGDLSSIGTIPAPGAVTLNLGIEDDPNDSFATRDQFQVSVTDNSGSSVAVIGFSPNADDNLWDISVGPNSGSLVPTGRTIESGFGYYFAVDFTASQTDISYGGSISFDGSVPGVPLATLGTFGPVGTATFGDIRMTHLPDQVEAAGTSANTLVFDNIAVNVVPEPSSALLILGALPLAFRRRRA